MVGIEGASGTPRAHRYFPELDGLRALAVIAVLFFHAGERDATGGFVGVSLFFTLSGFLITGLLIDEVSAEGRIAIRAFWGRRVRRLMPAAVVCLGLVLVTSPWLVEGVSIVRLRADIVAAAADVANWRFVTAHQSYAELFARRPSAVLHFWSLAIEEQFYIVYPCIIALLAKLAGRRRPWVLPVGIVVLIAGSITSSVAATSHDLIYYGTHTRAAELLIGGLLAWAIRRPTFATGVAHLRSDRLGSGRLFSDGPRAQRHMAAQVAGFAALTSFVVLVMRTSQTDAWLYRGGFALLAIVWCVLIVAARSPGWFGSMLSVRPLVALGRRSYGVYLFHWPVFTLLTPARLGVHGWPARLIQFAVIAGITEVSYRFVERPIRLRRMLTDRLLGPAVACACVTAVIAAAMILPTPATTNELSTMNMAGAPDGVVHLAAANSVPNADRAGGTTTTASTSTASTTNTSRPSVSTTNASSTNVSTTNVSTIASTNPPSLAILVEAVGSVPAIAQTLEVMSQASNAPAGRHGDPVHVSIDDATMAGCAAIVATQIAVGDSTCLPQSSGRRPADVLVIGLGAAEHAALQQALALTPGQNADDEYAIAQNLTRQGVAEFERLGRRALSVVIVDANPRHGTPDLLDVVIDEAVLSTPSLRRISLADLRPSDIGILGSVQPAASRPIDSPTTTAPAPARLKVMVIGDSTSYGFAQALARSTTEPFDVLWSGKRNCPIARMDSIRWSAGNEFSMLDCPSISSVWPEQISTFRPDVIMVVDGLAEQSQQRYAGDDTWYEAGDPTYSRVHDADFRGLLDLAASVGAVVVVADQPHDAPDTVAHWATVPRIDAWNAQLATWDRQWAPVTVLPYGKAVESAEMSAGHSLRPDGLHLDEPSVLNIVGTVLAPVIVQQVRDLRPALVASGCLIQSASSPRLDLARCG